MSARLPHVRVLHARGSSRARAVLHQHRQAGLRADEPAGNGQGRALRRYSRSAKSLRRLFLDEFLGQVLGRCAERGNPAVGDRTRANAVRARPQRVRRRLGRPTRRRAHRLRGRLERADQGARMGPPDGVPRAVHALRAVHRRAGRPLEIPRARRGAARRSPTSSRARWTRRSRPTRDGFRRWKRTSAEVPEDAGRFRRRLPLGHSRQGARHTARAAAGGHDVERRPLRHRTGLRSAAAPDARASARGSPGARTR